MSTGNTTGGSVPVDSLDSSIHRGSLSHGFPPSLPSKPRSSRDLPPLPNDEDDDGAMDGKVALNEFDVLKQAIGLGSKQTELSGKDIIKEKSASRRPSVASQLTQLTHRSPTIVTTSGGGDTHSTQLPSATHLYNNDNSNTLSRIPLTGDNHQNTLDQNDDAAGRPSSLSNSRSRLNDYRMNGVGDETFGAEPKGVVGKTRPRAVLRVERDYAAAGATTGRVQFWDGWLEELEGRITPLQFQNTLNELNAVLASAYDPSNSILDNFFAVLTIYISPCVFGTHYSREMQKFGDILARENATVYNPVGLHLLDPRKVGFLFLEIEYY